MNDLRLGATTMARRHCGRCGAAIKENNFCDECREFFRVLNAQKVKVAAQATERLRT
jgi:hypothetical protein